MWDTCTSHFGPKKFDRVGRRGQGRSKYGTFGSFQWEMCKNALFWPSLTPPANPVKFFWSKMACTCVPHIVLHVSCRTRTSGGYFRPSEVRFRAKIPLSSHWFYNVKTQKTHFLKILEWADFDLLESNCRHIFLHKNQKIYHSQFFFSWYMFSSHVSHVLGMNLLDQYFCPIKIQTQKIKEF